MRQIVLALALVFSLCGAASAQPRASAATVATETAVRGVVAQYQAALLRERRVADERSLALLNEAEARVRAARAAYATATSQRAASLAALETARQRYIELVNEVSVADAIARLQIEAFRAEVQGVVAQATPELVSAYQAFADGDRASAWPALETLLRARATATLAAARAVAAVEVRQLAQLRDIMASHGEASHADSLAIWEQAAALDPQDFATQVRMATLNLNLNRAEQAAQAAARAEQLATTNHQRAVIGVLITTNTASRADMAGLHAAIERQRTLITQVAAEATSDEELSAVSQTYGQLAAYERIRGDRRRADAYFREALAAVQRMPRVRAQPGATSEEAAALHHAGRAQVDDVAARRRYFLQSLAIAERIAAAEPNSAYAQRDLASAHSWAGGSAENSDQALPHFQAALAIMQRLHERDPTWIEYRVGIAQANLAVGFAHTGRRDRAGALRHYNAALQVFRDILRENPTSVIAKEGMLPILTEIANQHSERGEYAEAEALLQERVVIARELATPEETAALGSLRTYYNAQLDIAFLMQSAGRDAAALEAARAVLPFGRSLVARDSVSAESSLISNLKLLGELLSAAGNDAESLAAHEEALAITRRILARDPSDRRRQQGLVEALLSLGDWHVDRRRRLTAGEYFDEALRIARPLYENDPGSHRIAHTTMVISERLAYLDNTRERWTALVAILEDMQARGILFERYVGNIERYRRFAAAAPE